MARPPAAVCSTLRYRTVLTVCTVLSEPQRMLQVHGRHLAGGRSPDVRRPRRADPILSDLIRSDSILSDLIRSYPISSDPFRSYPI